MMALKGLNVSVTVAGKVISIDPDNHAFSLQARSGDIFVTSVGATTYYQVLSNLDGLWRDRVADPEAVNDEDSVSYNLRKYLRPDTPVFVEGIYQANEDRTGYEARTVHLMSSVPGQYIFEQTHWWLVQISQMADRWLDVFFDAKRSYEIDDFSKFYRTNLNITGGPSSENVQECATLSRLIYGLSSAYLLTGAERYYLAAKAGVAYQREAFRSFSHDGRYCFWAFGRRRHPGGEQLIIPSENPDDRDAIPLYEQIYALAGLAQYYRITLEWEVLEDIRRTLNTFQDYYLDDERSVEVKGFPGERGYFSHLDYSNMRPDSPALGPNQSRKNWNSIGDHIPAYLINLILALDPVPKGPRKRKLEELLHTCRWILEETSQLIVEKFPDPRSDYVNERFHADWTPDHTWGWQQNRAIVGHNLKIAWNLTRCAFYFQNLEKLNRDQRNFAEADEYKKRAEACLVFARRLGRSMGDVGLDKIRGGIFDAVERNPTNDMPTQFAWGSTKDFWQQEQGILAYLILHGAEPSEKEFLELARESLSFWNLFFLDRDRQGIFFRTSEDGVPITEGSYGQKGGHSISGYHAFELNYLAHLYIRSFVIAEEADDNGFCLYFKLSPNRDQESINVLPDFFPPGLVRITSIRVDGVDRTDDLAPANPNDFQIPLETSERPIELAVEFSTLPA
jgi:mannose/cellobiose epimerase-like protein (N-acyl-D-glucosamine 2-epimerase family)